MSVPKRKKTSIQKKFNKVTRPIKLKKTNYKILLESKYS